MDPQSAKRLVDDAFERIKECTSIDCLKKISKDLQIPRKNLIDTESFSKIEFALTEGDIAELKRQKIISLDLFLNPGITGKIVDPLTKLLYALAWKNGDLKKVRHILKGVLHDCPYTTDPEDGFVFHQFGRYLTKRPGEPIVDQHVLRAFGIHQVTDEGEIQAYQQMELIGKKQAPLITLYRSWGGANFIL